MFKKLYQHVQTLFDRLDAFLCAQHGTKQSAASALIEEQEELDAFLQKRRATVRYLARHLYYRQVDALIGKTFVVNDPSALAAAVCEQVEFFEPSVAFDESHAEYAGKTLSKHGLIDWNCPASSHQLTATDRCGMKMLKELALVFREAEFYDADGVFEIGAAEFNFGWLKSAEEDIQKDPPTKILLMMTWQEFERPTMPSRRIVNPKMPDVTFPITLKIKDAALSNTRFAWSARYVYM